MRMAGAAGLEPVTSAVTGQRSNQLSYAPAMGAILLRKSGSNVNGKSPGIFDWDNRGGGHPFRVDRYSEGETPFTLRNNREK